MALNLIFATDPHFRATRPISRKDDDFFGTILGKLEKIRILSKNYELVIFGGDIFDRPDVPHSVVIKVMRAFSKFEVPVYTVIGNHDIFGYQGATVESSAMGTLLESGVVKRLDSFIMKGVAIYGIHAFDGEAWELPESDAVKVIVAHKLITNTPVPGGDCIPLRKVAQATNANLILSGDIHYPHFEDDILGKTFVNPGSLSRMSITDRERYPQVAAITIESDGEIHCDLHVLDSRPAECLFDLTSYSNRMASEEHREGFVKTYVSAVFSVKAEAHNVGSALAKAAEDNKLEGGVAGCVDEYYKRAEKEILHEIKD